MVLRWISLVPVKTRNMRSLRKACSTGWPRVTPTLPWICTALSATSKQRSETNSLQAAAFMRRSAPASASAAVCAIMLSQAHSAAAMSASMC